MDTKDRLLGDGGFGEAAYAALARGMPASEVWSLLLSAMRERAEQRTARALAEQWERDRFVQLSYIDQRTLVELDSHLLAAAADFEAVELSPLAPLGASSSVALTTQNRVVSTVRGTEVVSDPTNVLALESARRLREDPTRVVRFCTSHRCVRAQEVPKVPGFAAHFRMFCMTSAGARAQGSGVRHRCPDASHPHASAGARSAGAARLSLSQSPRAAALHRSSASRWRGGSRTRSKECRYRWSGWSSGTTTACAS